MKRSPSHPSRLSADVEKRLRPLEERSAVCYNHAEKVSRDLREIAARIEEDEEDTEEEGVVLEDLRDEDSLVHAISDVQHRSRTR